MSKDNFDDLGFQSFDDLGFADDAAQPVEETGPSKTESFIRGAANSASLGFADEAAGALGAVSDVVGPNHNLSELFDRYAANRDESRQLYKEAEEANPMTYLGGNLAGGLGTALVPGMAPATLAKMAGLGAVAGIGSSEADNLGGMTRDAATGAAIGGATGVIGKGISKAANELGETYLGQMGKRQFNLGELGHDTSSEAGRAAMKGQAEGLGNEILDTLDNNVARAKEVKTGTLLKGTKNVAGDVSQISNDLVNDIGLITDAGDETGADLVKLLSGADKLKRASSGELSEAIENYQRAMPNVSGKPLPSKTPPKVLAEKVDELHRSFRAYNAGGDNSTSSAEGKRLAKVYSDKLKALIGESLDPTDAALVQDMNNQIHSNLEVKKAILGVDEKALTGLDKVNQQAKVQDFFSRIGKSGVVGVKSDMKTNYLLDKLEAADPLSAEKVLNNATTASKIYGGLRDVETKPISGVLDLLSGSQMYAKTANKMGQGYAKAAKIVGMPSEKFSKMADLVLGSNLSPAVKTKLNNVFKTMSTSDEQKKAALIYGLQQNPEYRAAMKSLGLNFDKDSNE